MAARGARRRGRDRPRPRARRDRRRHRAPALDGADSPRGLPVVPGSAVAAAETLAGQLRLTREREPLHQVFEGLSRLGGLLELFLAKRELVEGRGNLVALRPLGLDPRVLDGGAVELRLREEALADAVLRVVRQF